MTQSEFDKLQKFFDNELYGSGVKDVFDNIVKNEVKFTEPNVTLSDSLKEGIKKASIDGVRDAVAKMNKDFASTLPDEIKNFAGLTDSEWQSIISKSRNNNKQELDIISTNSLKNVVKREFLTKLKGVKNLDEDAINEYFTNNFKGDCLLAVGDEDLIKIHFHTNEPWKVLEYCASLGEIYDIVVEDMDRQSRGLKG